ncbi:glycosyltransferase [Pusillimonas sp. TS35]|uniref:glycosyltransferase family 4 protein n=1 Tax=Paracandidimonas lactea TaxID=2895524 RepID=UPI00136FAAAB|nr:glycosyltransferase [Paracandidimonas lactea]MYN13577.1 glycosyltransferase [Pusillimonas sp. TS35]
MKVLHIITGLNNGGAEGALFRLCSSDDPGLYQHEVISMMDMGVYGERLERAGIPVTCLGMPRGRLTVHGLMRLVRTLRRVKPDVVQTWLYHADLIGGTAARLTSAPAVVWGIRHANFDIDSNARRSLLVIRLCSLLSRIVPDRIACCSEKARALHVSIGYPDTRISVIPNGYVLDTLAPCPEAGARLRAELSLPADRPLLGMVARFDPQKDHGNLLAALGQLRERGVDFSCLLAGAEMTANNAALARMADTAGISDRLMLLGPRSDVPDLMNALDIHVLSSRGEAFPNVLAEAMACGTPCVSTDVGDAALIIGDTGWLAPRRDATSLADAMQAAIAALAEPETWRVRRIACRARIAANFDIQRMLARYHSLWQEVLAQNPQAASVRP